MSKFAERICCSVFYEEIYQDIQLLYVVPCSETTCITHNYGLKSEMGKIVVFGQVELSNILTI